MTFEGGEHRTWVHELEMLDEFPVPEPQPDEVAVGVGSSPYRLRFGPSSHEHQIGIVGRGMRIDVSMLQAARSTL